MTKARKILAVLMCLITLLSVCSIAVGCPPTNNEQKKERYNLNIVIACKRLVNGRPSGEILGKYLFTTDSDEKHISRLYNGIEYIYYVYQYNVPDHPQWKDLWVTPDERDIEVMYWESPQKFKRGVCEQGEYQIKFRIIRTFIPDVKDYKVMLSITVE